MYDRHKAKELGLITSCHANLVTPITVHGYYRCTEGHAHYVSWVGTFPHTSSTGYDYAFLAALDAADDLAIVHADPETQAYHRLYNAELDKRGYSTVTLPLQPEGDSHAS